MFAIVKYRTLCVVLYFTSSEIARMTYFASLGIAKKIDASKSAKKNGCLKTIFGCLFTLSIEDALS
jgi:hypothetical protein